MPRKKCSVSEVVETLKPLNNQPFDRELAVAWVQYLTGVVGFKRNKELESGTIAVFELIEGKTHYTMSFGKDVVGNFLITLGNKLATAEDIARVEKLTVNVVKSAPVVNSPTPAPVENVTVSEKVKIKVRQWLTRTNDNPLPMRTMAGEILRETANAIQVRLTGILEPSSECLHCGRELKHPISLLYGIGPKCGQHFYINPLNSEEELQERYDEMCAKMQDVTWEGWIPKSQIVNRTPYHA